MPRVRLQKSSFASGEISADVLGRSDLRAYDNGALKLRNVFVQPTGGVTRRHGLRFVDHVKGAGRLVAFEFNTEQTYVLVFTDSAVDVYRQGVHLTSFATPWTLAETTQLRWTQSADTLLVVHPNVPPKRIIRRTDISWELSDWRFFSQGGRVLAPHHKFADQAVTLKPSGTSGAITVTASAPVFNAQHVGSRLRISDKELEITSFLSFTQIGCQTREPLISTEATEDWTEQVFSPVRGWPISVCFHQDRLVIGGSRDLPNRLWLSKSGDLFNFDLGEGLDDESIEFPLLSDHVNAIRNVFSGRHLQVFTSGAEWMVSGDPLTPTTIQLRRQTRTGSFCERSIPNRDVDGVTLFIPRIGTQLRGFLFTDTEQAYQAPDLALLANHLIVDPVDMDFDKRLRLLHVVGGDGNLATLTVYRDEDVSAWSLQQTNGRFLSVAAAGDETYVLVDRSNGFSLEVFDPALQVDSGLIGESATPLYTWSGLSHLEGRQVKIMADQTVAEDATVEDGQITLENAASALQVGLAYAHCIEPLPVSVASQPSLSSGKYRPISVTFKLLDTGALYLDTGNGPRELSFRIFGPLVLDHVHPLFSGDKTVRLLGWRNFDFKPLWRIEQDVPMPFTLLSIATELAVNS